MRIWAARPHPGCGEEQRWCALTGVYSDDCGIMDRVNYKSFFLLDDAEMSVSTWVCILVGRQKPEQRQRDRAFLAHCIDH